MSLYRAAETRARRALDARRSETQRIRDLGRRVVLGGALAPRRALRAGSLPDFVIAGAQRTGTTSLFNTLLQHPQVPPLRLGIKGVHYFDTAAERPVSWYRAHFPTDRERRDAAAAGRPLVVGEASPYYVFHPTALQRLDATVPDVKVIVLLRDPIMRALSHYRHMVWEGDETLSTFEEALAAESGRLAGQEELLLARPGAVSAPHQHHSYLARSRYADQIRRAADLFGDRLLVVVSEELFDDPTGQLVNIATFLGIDPTFPFDLPRMNSTPGTDLLPETLDLLHRELDPDVAELEALLGRPLPWTTRICDREAG